MPATVVVEPELAWENYLLRPWLEQLLYEFYRQGFRAIIMLTGHYGHNQQIVVRETAARMAERLRIPVLGTPEYWLALMPAIWATMLGSVKPRCFGTCSRIWWRLDRIDSDPDYGRDGRIRDGSSPELGKRYADLIVHGWLRWRRRCRNGMTVYLDHFIAAERALVAAKSKAGAVKMRGQPGRGCTSMFTMANGLLPANLIALLRWQNDLNL